MEASEEDSQRFFKEIEEFLKKQKEVLLWED